MAEKLLPPTIESKLPAQFGDTISIPFLHNRSVGIEQYTGMVLKIKTISSNQEIAILYNENKNSIFSIDKEVLKVGQHYKAQLAYYVGETIGYYSTVGIFKYTKKPKVSISANNVELDITKNNIIGSQIDGYYRNEDSTEKVYSYCFNIYKDDELFVTSGEQIHVSETDTNTESVDSFSFNYLLDITSVYTVEYKVKTTNGLEVSSPKYYFTREVEVPKTYKCDIIATVDKENGGVNIKMKYDGVIQGHFRLSRRNSDRQDIIKEFTINDISNGSYDLGTDYTVQQGVEYIYSIQQFSSKLVTEPIETDSIYIDFEDAFLFDGERQLKIKFNPKVSSFKETILESKLDTIGGQYPFVFRNGRTKYKEFPISGLISYWMDNENLFTLNKNEFSTNLTGNVIAEERQFKLEVLQWLNNGKPKLFRSPTEGNYIVRLMNISLSPNDTVGRMLHTFNCNAYEIAEYNSDNLKKYGFIGEQKDFNKLWNFFSINIEPEKTKNYTLDPSALWARIYGPAGTRYTLSFESNSERVIQIGITGMYEISCPDDFLKSISVFVPDSVVGTYEYKVEYASTQVDLEVINYEGQPIKSISVRESGASFENETNAPIDVISEIISENSNLNKILLLDNILLLRLEYIGESTGSSEIRYSYPDRNDEFAFMLGRTEEIEINGILKQIIAGRLELTAQDFDNKFVLQSLKIGPNIRADIYYKIKEIELAGEK